MEEYSDEDWANLLGLDNKNLEMHRRIHEKVLAEKMKGIQDYNKSTKFDGGNKMETKSRYEVISDLEKQKRQLILERDGLNDQLKDKEKAVKNMERYKTDSIVTMDRKIEDLKEDLENFKTTMNERKETIVELIKSVDESLGRFSQIQKKE